MGSPSKEDVILDLILESSPLKHWHFEELVKETKMTRASVNKWLKKLVKEKILFKIKEKNKFSYFTVGKNNQEYYCRKKLRALQKIYESGLVQNLVNQEKARNIVLFGSMSKGDYYANSDIDLFILGNISDFNKKVYERKLLKNIELHIFKNKEELKKLKSGLIKNVLNGYVIKGDINNLL